MTKENSTSPELTGGAGFTYEDTVVAYYLAALLREERAAGQTGVVVRVGVQQAPTYPLDDLVVQFRHRGTVRTLSLQIKRSVVISGANGNDIFRAIFRAAAETLANPGFATESDAYGFVVEHVAVDRRRDLDRLIGFAKISPDGASFEACFDETGAASKATRELREELSPLIQTASPEQEWQFYRHLVAKRMDGLEADGPLGAGLVNRLGELAADPFTQGEVLRDVLCGIAREGAGTGGSWTRESLLRELRDKVALKVAPSYASDMARLEAFSRDALADISNEIAGAHVDRPRILLSVREQMARHRLVNLSGLPGSGKSVVLKGVATTLGTGGPLLFLKYDRIEGRSWSAFAEALGLEHGDPTQILAEVGSSGTPTLFVDGIDRIDPERKGVVTDILRAIEGSEHLDHWTVLASTRDQGLEGYRTWFPASFYGEMRIGDVTVGAFDDDEAMQLAKAVPALSPLLFASSDVAALARRPFFAAVLARSSKARDATPQTEIDLVAAWWRGGGYDVPPPSVVPRQRALLDVAGRGLRTLGRRVPTGKLREASLNEVGALVADGVLQSDDDGGWYSFAHDIFFEWVLFRRLVELEQEWTDELARTGEPPLLGRVVGLLAQKALERPGAWSAGYRSLETEALRPQWRREWLTAPPFTSVFAGRQTEFAALLAEDDHRLLDRFLLWFQAHHTTPNPQVLTTQGGTGDSERVHFADLLGWPSDAAGWTRLLGWLIPAATTLPRRFAPAVVQVFSVWQNMFANAANGHSAAIVDLCSAWLVELEDVLYGPPDQPMRDTSWAGLNGQAKTDVATELRWIIARSALAYPRPMRELYERAAEDPEMRRKAYAELMVFSPIAAGVCPETLAAVAKAELMEELPGDRRTRRRREQKAHFARLRRVREKPSAERTAEEQRLVSHSPFPVDEDRIDADNIGIKRYQTYYHPSSPLHEPFAGLFASTPETAVALVRDLANHAVQGWRQNAGLHGTDAPVPVPLCFPWGDQVFWGDADVHEWFTIYASPDALECAFLALRHWAFQEIERGRPVDEVIRAVVEGSTCYGVLGLALALALETLRVSETVLPIVTCQRLWHDDVRRFVQESTLGMDLLDLGLQSRLQGDKAAAKAFLESRKYRQREIRNLAMAFAISGESALRERFKEQLAGFPEFLPYTTEGQREDEQVTAYLGQQARRWAELGDPENYRVIQEDGQPTRIAFESSIPRTEDEKQRMEEGTAFFEEHRVIRWAERCVEAGTVVDGESMSDAIRLARQRDHAALFDERRDAVDHSPQTVVSAVAAAALCTGDLNRCDQEWASDVMARVQAMREPAEALAGSRIPWHPAGHLVAVLASDRRTEAPRTDSAARLFRLSIHPVDEVAKAAFVALLSDRAADVQWAAGRLVLALSVRPRPDYNVEGAGTDAAAEKQRAVEDAIEALGGPALPWPVLPAPWAKVARRQAYGSRSREWEEWEEWGDPDPYFDARAAAKLVPMFPIESWSRSPAHKPLLCNGLGQLVTWTAAKIGPDWDATGRDDAVRRAGTELLEWNGALAQNLARSAPFLDVDVVRREHLDPFAVDNEDAFSVVAEFIVDTVVRHVIDAPNIPANTLTLLDDCAERVLRHPAFRRASYRAGELSGWSLPKSVRALLFIPIDEVAPGSARFANGDWSEIRIAMPIVSRLVAQLAWSRDVMQCVLQLCERAGGAYPIEAFAGQVAAAVEHAEQWSGTTIPARIAATIQRLTDANYRIDADLASRLLGILDVLVELGDRRSVALEQSPAFREVQGE